MKAFGSSLGIIASIFTIVATGLRLKWHRVSSAPGPTPPQTGTQKFLRIAAGIWLIFIGIAVFVGVIILAVLPIIRMSN